MLFQSDFVDSEEEDEEGGDDDIQWLGYKEVSDMNGGKSFVSYDKPKLKTGELIDIVSGKTTKCRGPILLYKQWWQVTFLRTKVSQKDRYREPKDRYALCYRLRDDPRCRSDNLAQLLISEVLRQTDNPKLFDMRQQFEQHLRCTKKGSTLDLFNLQECLERYCESYSDPEEEMTPQTQFMNAIIHSGQFCQVKLGQTHPQLLHYLPQFFPFHFTKLLALKEDILDGLVQCIEEEPGNLAFKAVLSKRYNVLGVETSKDALIKSGLMSKVPKYQQDAIEIYEYLKNQTREFGHTWVLFDKIMTQLSKEVSLWDEAMEFLNKHKITKTQMDSGHRIVYLQILWKAENQISKGLNSLIRKNELQPWDLEVDFTSEDFETIMADNDQNRAAKLIASQPVCAISGKGGCGKTYVVTQVLKAATANRSSKKEDDKDEFHDIDEDMTQMEEESADPCSDSCPDEINILLTAPTGKAANLLGKRADMTSCTLHQVIWSFRMLQPGTDWRHKDVNILVVDECSLVSVQTMAFLLELLLKNSKLRRVVLLGDIRQLPSIEPGNFLKDTFQSLDAIGFSVELRTNHRAESQAIVDNATAISLKRIPTFDKEKFLFRRIPDGNPGSNGNDYMLQDINDDIIKLLSHDSLKSHVNSQFISFTRRVCDAVNDLCCKHYSKHRIMEFKKYVFRTGDKICCCKNGYVNIYTEKHGLMTCNKDATDGEKEEAGGVDRTILTGAANETMMGQDGDKTLQPGQDNPKPNPTKQIRLCNGEIFFITEEIERQTDKGQMMTFLGLSEDADPEKTFWVEKRQLRKSCKIRHAWARTIHTFQGSETDHVVYIVGSRSWRQNWQHVYTAVTRGRKTVFIIGQENVLRSAIRRPEIRRQTGLKKQLLLAFQKDKILSADHAVNSTILCPADKSDQSKLTSTAQWLADCNTVSPNTGTNGPSASRGKSNNCTMFQKWRQNKPSSRHDLNVTGNLNNTQAMTDILSSLASEHASEADNTCPPDDNTDDNDSPSLLKDVPPVWQPKSTQNQRSNNALQRSSANTAKAGYGEDIIEVLSSDAEDELIDPTNVEGDSSELDDVSDIDSVKSESLLATPSPSVGGYTKLRSRSNKASDTDEGHNKLKSISNQDCDRDINISSFHTLAKEGSNRFGNKSKRNMQDTISPIVTETDWSIDGKKQVLSHRNKGSSVTPLSTNDRHLLNSTNRFSSSPAMTSSHTCISTPKSAGDGSFNTSASAHKPLTECYEIKEPSSNESMWSEVDDSLYLDVSDSNLLGTQVSHLPGVSGIEAPHVLGKSAFPVVKYITSRQSPNSTSDKLSPFSCVGNGYRNGRLSRTPSENNQSTCSQWSEVDDDQYITTLDLADIEHMATQRSLNLSDPDRDYMPTEKFASGSVCDEGKTPPNLLTSFSNHRSTDVTPPEESDLDSSIISNTPPQELGGFKRQLSWKNDEVSPMKRRLSTLKFD